MRRFLPIAVLLVVVFLLYQAFPYALQDENARMRLLYLVLMLSLMAGARSRFRNRPMPRLVRDAAIWLGAILLLVFAYSFRDEIAGSRLMAELVPSRIHVNADGSLSIRASEDGHFHVAGEVNGVPVRFMVDTGASGIVLGPEDARRAGIDPESLDYSRLYSTANGMGTGASVTLASLTIGAISLERVPASVNRAEMSESLLGMSFLQRLKGFRVEGSTLVLIP